MILTLEILALTSIFVLGMSLVGVRPIGAALIVVAALPIAVIVWALFNLSFG